MKKQLWRFALLLILSFLSMQIVSAQIRPTMAVYAVWTPDEQLTSISGDDRFVDLQIYAQGNVAFWAINLTCTVGSVNTLDLVSLTFPQEWGAVGTDFFASPTAPIDQYTGTGILSFTATRLGATNSQMGMNGQNYTQLIATARFKVEELAANTRAAATCNTMDFIDRNGTTAIRGRQTRFNDLQIYVGYTLSGTVLRQGSRAHQNIKVTCDLIGNFPSSQSVFTASNGTFRFGGINNSASALRAFGDYRCTFESQFVQGVPNNQILLGYVEFELNTANYNLLPISLRSGDADHDGTIEFLDDVTTIAAGNGAINLQPFTANDMNGDGKIDRIDMVFAASNMGLDDIGNGFLNNHIIYSIGRDLDGGFTYPNSRVYLGYAASGDISPMNSRSRTRDFWGQLSPDGTQVALVSQDSRSGLHQLALMNVSNGSSSTVRFSRDFTDHVFAPSWSPDGNRIAFICSPNGGNSVNVGFLYNRGDICIMNAADRNGAAINRLGVSAGIFPPAWLNTDDGFVLIYGGSDGDIHYYDFATSTHGTLAIGDVVSADIVDMPVIVNYAYSDTNYLAYRFNDNDGSYDPAIRVASVDFSSGSFTGGIVGALAAEHVSLSATTTGVDYYDVSPTMDILFYREYNFAKTNFPSQDPFLFISLPHNDGSPLTWFGASEYIPDGSVGNPSNVADSSSTYNPTATNPTYLHAWRMTFDYVP